MKIKAIEIVFYIPPTTGSSPQIEHKTNIKIWTRKAFSKLKKLQIELRQTSMIDT